MMRVSFRSQKGGGARHNDRDFDVENASHIDESKSHFFEWSRVIECSFEQGEIEYYSQTYSKWLAAQNLKHQNSRHLERVKTMEQVYESKQYCPNETILQIGNKDEHVSAEQLQKIWDDSVKKISEFNKTHGSHIRLLNVSLHNDEATPHIHVRWVANVIDRDGNLKPNTTQALKEMGFERPDMSKPEGRFNNRKISFDKRCREVFQEVVRSRGIEIETQPIPGRRHLGTDEFVYQQKINEFKQREEFARNAEKQMEYSFKQNHDYLEEQSERLAARELGLLENERTKALTKIKEIEQKLDEYDFERETDKAVYQHHFEAAERSLKRLKSKYPNIYREISEEGLNRPQELDLGKIRKDIEEIER